MKSFGEELRQLRLAKGFTQQQLAERSGSGVSQGGISDLETGRWTNPKTGTLRDIAAALPVSYVRMLVLAGHLLPGDIENYVFLYGRNRND